MKKIFGFLILSCLLSFPFVSCNKNTTDTPPAKPKIVISAPTDMQMYNYGDTIWLKTQVSHNTELHEVAVTLKSTDSTWFQYEKHVDAPTFQLDTFLINKVKTDTEMTLTITAEDHDGNSSSSIRQIHCMH